ncbi:MAG: hypothetical protein M0R33_11650 [Methylomonas sp.]|jgi:hypothetical protein|uniref:hypothetical protein n=1 Tax=Methylomonas sp. TaxID=418 RepID=UPI0025FFC04C|nr:hypothetical protein [Methylomonas sp.]MCK9607089.1 hypothetical protein [Methylomonas sp.]
MKRSRNLQKTGALGCQEINRETAIHEAGHAAGIYFGNRQKALPVVFFRIYIQPDKRESHTGWLSGNPNKHYAAKIEGGRLIHALPYSFAEATKHFTPAQKQDYQRAFEADMFNLLIGPLAEAKYVSLRDDESHNFGLVHLDSLHFYGGSSDLEAINEYIDCFLRCNALKEDKISDLFKAACRFVNEPSHWRAIINLADAILAAENQIIEYDDIVAVLEQGQHIASTPRPLLTECARKRHQPVETTDAEPLAGCNNEKAPTE